MNKIDWLASREPRSALEARLTHAREAYRRQPSQANVELCETLYAAIERQKASEGPKSPADPKASGAS